MVCLFFGFSLNKSCEMYALIYLTVWVEFVDRGHRKQHVQFCLPNLNGKEATSFHFQWIINLSSQNN